MMKKIVSVLISIFVLLNISVLAFASKPVTLTVTGGEIYAGDIYTVKLLISDNSQISGAIIDMNYDSDKLEFIEAKAGGILDQSAQISIKNLTNKSCVRFAYMSGNSYITSEGTLMTVKFKALDDSFGKTDLKLSIPSSGDFVNNKLERVSYEFKNSSINILNDSISETAASETTENESSSVTETTIADTQTSVTEKEVDNEKNSEKNNDILWPIVLISAGVIAIVSVIVLVIKRKGDKK